jgi:hypothetical protein
MKILPFDLTVTKKSSNTSFVVENVLIKMTGYAYSTEDWMILDQCEIQGTSILIP